MKSEPIDFMQNDISILGTRIKLNVSDQEKDKAMRALQLVRDVENEFMEKKQFKSQVDLSAMVCLKIASQLIELQDEKKTLKAQLLKDIAHLRAELS